LITTLLQCQTGRGQQMFSCVFDTNKNSWYNGYLYRLSPSVGG